MKVEVNHHFHKNWRFLLQPEVRQYGNKTTIRCVIATITLWWY